MALIYNQSLKVSQNITNFLYQLRDESNFAAQPMIEVIPPMKDIRGESPSIQYIRNAVCNATFAPQFTGYKFSVVKNHLTHDYSLMITADPLATVRSTKPRPQPKPKELTNLDTMIEIAAQLYGQSHVLGQDPSAPKYHRHAQHLLAQDMHGRNGMPLSNRAYHGLCAKAHSVLNDDGMPSRCKFVFNNKTGERFINVAALIQTTTAVPQAEPVDEDGYTTAERRQFAEEEAEMARQAAEGL